MQDLGLSILATSACCALHSTQRMNLYQFLFWFCVDVITFLVVDLYLVFSPYVYIKNDKYEAIGS